MYVSSYNFASKITQTILIVFCLVSLIANSENFFIKKIENLVFLKEK